MEMKTFVFVGLFLQVTAVFGIRGLPNTATRFAENEVAGYYRLPNQVLPKSYTIRIVPFLDEGNFTFKGDVEIALNVKETTNSITLHSKDLIVMDHVLVDDLEPSVSLPIVNVTDYEDREFHVLYLENPLIKDGRSYTLRMSFEGELKDDLDGFYRSSYVNLDGKKEWMAVTQFEANSARKAFPCFDEPHLKATFALSVGRPEGLNTLSNMVIKRGAVPDPALPTGYVWDIYGESPIMSTYLLAFAVSKFEANPPDAKNVFRVWSREDAIRQTNYSAEVGPKILDAMKIITSIPFQLPKMDLIAVPDFQFGAMENWGLVTFRETFLLYESATSTPYDKQQVITVVAHELGHQWFGDLVTPEWWTYIWLSEGFATYCMYTVTDLIEPSWRVMEQFVIENVQLAFLSDAMNSTRVMSYNVTEVFDLHDEARDVIYSKAGSVIRMMEHILSRDEFFQGLYKYLTDNQYSTVNEDLLFSALNTVASDDGYLPEGVTVGDIMRTWTQQNGYPVINVNRNYEYNSITVTQERFVLEDVSGGVNIKWWVPLSFTNRRTLNFESTRPAHWTYEDATTIFMGDIPHDKDWVLFNIQSTGYYRVNYDERNWMLLIEHLKSTNYDQIHPINRAQLIDDSLNLARGGYISYNLALDLTHYLAQETDFIPWYSAFNALDFLDVLLAKSSSYPNFGEYMNYLMKTQYDNLNFNESSSDDHIVHLSRAQLLPKACKYNYGDCVSTATKLFNAWKQTNLNKIPANFRSTAYCFGVSGGGGEEWDFLWRAYQGTTNAAEQQRIREALGCSKVRSILEKYMSKTVDGSDDIRLQDRATVFSSVFQRTEGLDVALDFLIERYDEIVEKCGKSTAVKVISGISSRISSLEQSEKMKTFLNINQDEIGSDTTDSALQQMDSNLNWLKTNGPIVESWLKENHGL